MVEINSKSFQKITKTRKLFMAFYFQLLKILKKKKYMQVIDLEKSNFSRNFFKVFNKEISSSIL